MHPFVTCIGPWTSIALGNENPLFSLTEINAVSFPIGIFYKYNYKWKQVDITSLP